MLTFDPPSLRDDLAKALTQLEDIVCYEGYPFHNDTFDPSSYDDEVITTQTTFQCGLDSSENSLPEITVAEILEWARSLAEDRLTNRTTLRTPTKTLVYVEPTAITSSTDLMAADTTLTVQVDGIQLQAKLRFSQTLFAVHIEAEGLNDHHLSSFYDETCLVEVTHAPKTSSELVDSIVTAYLYEMASSAQICLAVRPYPYITYDEDEDTSDAPTTADKPRLRPLQWDRGLLDVYKLFLDGCSADPAQYALIHFVKIVEYVSATVVRQARHACLRQRLLGRQALTPDAAFLDGLCDLLEEQRIFKKDSEAVKLTLRTCCDPLLLSSDAPACVPLLKKLKSTDETKKSQAAIDELADVLSATRNQLLHAKPNYTCTGQECPPDQIDELTYCARTAADQVIRWFVQLPAHARLC